MTCFVAKNAQESLTAAKTFVVSCDFKTVFKKKIYEWYANFEYLTLVFF